MPDEAKEAIGATNSESETATNAAAAKVDDLFESPYLVLSAEAPADFSDIGNGRSATIDASIDRLISDIPLSPRSNAEEAFDTPLFEVRK
jgi:hypothetical protein